MSALTDVNFPTGSRVTWDQHAMKSGLERNSGCSRGSASRFFKTLPLMPVRTLPPAEVLSCSTRTDQYQISGRIPYESSPY